MSKKEKNTYKIIKCWYVKAEHITEVASKATKLPKSDETRISKVRDW